MDNETAIVELKDNSQLNKYIRELKEDLKITLSNIREKSMTVSEIRAKWLNYYHVEKENLERIKRAKEKILKQKMGEVKNKDSVLRLKSEESIAKNDETVQKLNKLAENTKSTINYLEYAQNILNDFGWNIRNSIEILKMERS